jgi:hypothetical protein
MICVQYRYKGHDLIIFAIQRSTISQFPMANYLSRHDLSGLMKTLTIEVLPHEVCYIF